MNNVKISLANVQGKLSRTQMKKVFGGLVLTHECFGPEVSCSYYESGHGQVSGKCQTNSASNCVCKSTNSSVITAQCDSQAVED